VNQNGLAQGLFRLSGERNVYVPSYIWITGTGLKSKVSRRKKVREKGIKVTEDEQEGLRKV